MKKRHIIYYLLSCTTFLSIQPVSFVYNLRVRRAFDVPFIIQDADHHLRISTLPNFLGRRSNPLFEPENPCIHEKRRTGAVMLNWQYTPHKKWFFEASTAIGTDQVRFTGQNTVHATRYGFDDIAFIGGHHHFFKNNIQLISYGLIGLPTERAILYGDRFDPLLGTRFYNIGAGCELSYNLTDDHIGKSCDFISQVRLIHSLSRSWFPILPYSALLQPGNTYDAQFAMRMRHNTTVLEYGYNLIAFSKRTIQEGQTKRRISNAFLTHSAYINVYHSIDHLLGENPAIIGIGGNVDLSSSYKIRTFHAFLLFTQSF